MSASKQSTLLLGLVSLFSVVALSSCAPSTFVRTIDPGWNTIDIREELEYDKAWNTVVDLVSRKFDIEIISKEDGYLRTGWYHAWTGELTERYAVRLVVKFTPDHQYVAIKSEAQYYAKGFWGIGRGWRMGTDERLSTTMRTDMMGKVGRVTR